MEILHIFHGMKGRPWISWTQNYGKDIFLNQIHCLILFIIQNFDNAKLFMK